MKFNHPSLTAGRLTRLAIKLLCSVLVFISIFCLMESNQISIAEQTSYDIAVSANQTSDKYNPSQSSTLKAFRYGKSSLGQFQITGNFNESTTYNGYTAFGLENGSIAFSYDYKGNYLKESDTSWSIINDGAREVGQIKLDASINKGALIIQKSYDNKTWTLAASPVVNYFSTVAAGKNKFYTADGGDIAKGTYYRVIFAYKMHKKKGNYGVFGVCTDYEEIWCSETYSFYVCTNTANISLHNMITEESSIALNRKIYETGGNYKYDPTKPATKMSYGSSGICKFNITGQFANNSSSPAILLRGNIILSLDYHGVMRSGSAESWKIFSSDAKEVNGIKLSDKMGMGAIIIQKSTDGKNYTNLMDPVTNVFGNHPNGFDICRFSDSGYYRIIVTYQTQRKFGTNIFGGDMLDNKHHVEVFEFKVEKKAIEGIQASEEEGYSMDVLEKGETLTDGATSTMGFVVDKLGTSYNVTINGTSAKDGQSFTENGAYDIQVTTPLGKTKSLKIYIFHDNETYGVSTYFKDVPVTGYRVFREGSLPTYDNRTCISLLSVPESAPALTGTITNLDTGEETVFDGTDRSEKNISLTEGTYHADLFSGNTESGSVYHYEFNFNIISEASKPNVNYNNLISADRLCDLSSQYYQVSYQTTRGGFISVCFADYQRAFNYAYEIEKRFVENGRYKSLDNPNVKIEYPNTNEGLIALTQAVNHYAEGNVEVSFFDPTDIFTYRTLDDMEKLENLETLSLPESVKVIPSEEEKAFMFSRQPFLNGFTFIQAADYDVVSVSAFCCRDNQTYPIEFGKPVDEQLTISSEYYITETNIYGDTNTYKAFFANENQTRITWKAADGIATAITEISTGSAQDITTTCAEIISTQNDTDDCSIVKIIPTGNYSYPITCKLSDLEGLALNMRGDYTFIFVDRVGNTFTHVIHIIGDPGLISLPEGTISYTDLYNKVYLQDKPTEH